MTIIQIQNFNNGCKIHISKQTIGNIFQTIDQLYMNIQSPTVYFIFINILC